MGPVEYEIGLLIGTGSFAKVYLGVNKITKQQVAIKQSKEPRAKAILESEAVAYSHIQSFPHKITGAINLISFFESSELSSLVLEYFRGQELLQFLLEYNNLHLPKRTERVPEPVVKRIIYSILRTISQLHAIGVSHGDLKLENILINADLETRIIDFGFAKVIAKLKQTADISQLPINDNGGVAIGPIGASDCYMSPEVVLQKSSNRFRNDVWALGIPKIIT